MNQSETIFVCVTRFDELKGIIKVLKNHKKIKDMANVLSGKLRSWM